MPSKKQYDLVQNDDYDTRIPLHPEEAFHHGITFQAKYIGMLDVPRPTSRVEIVAAMRRIRYEFKAKGIKKKKVTIEVSVDGVKVTPRKKKKVSRAEKSKGFVCQLSLQENTFNGSGNRKWLGYRRKHWLDEKPLLLSHPIYRIFYVSHDSQDLKIFSYIARDGASNVFKCAVFKSNKKSQAMRVVRTIGQAFEVCHKLSINAPENENQDQDEQDTLTQDLLSDRLSDIASDKQKKDAASEGTSDKLSLPPDDASYRDSYSDNMKSNAKPAQIDILPPPPATTRKSPLTAAETYSSPHSDVLTTGSGSSTTLPPPGTALSAHHEIQLMREQLEQQSQQTQAALAQLQLAREQLAAEQSARLEAQARTHQLLIHNRELLDHIASLVAHLQGGDKAGQQQTPPHVALPQQQHQGSVEGTNYAPDLSETASIDNSAIYQALGLNPQGLIENRAVTSHLPASPLRTTFNPAGTVFNFPYQQTVEPTYDPQLLQRFQNFTGYTPPSPFPYGYTQTLPYLSGGLYNPPPILNNNYTLQPPPKKLTTSPLTLRHSLGSSPTVDRKVSPGRSSEPRQQCSQQNIPTPPHYQSQQNLYQFSQGQAQGTNQLHIQKNMQQRQNSPQRENSGESGQFIKPLSQIGTLTTTDSEGRVRVLVPVPTNSADDTSNLLANLRLNDDLRTLNGPTIQRSTSEKVPNRSELMSQVQRGMWARHTTK